MKRVLVPVVACVLLVACRATESHRAATATAAITPTGTLGAAPVQTSGIPAPVVPSPSPTPPPIRAWDVPPKTGVAHVDAIITAITTGDSKMLEPFITGRLEPCSSDRGPSCAPGSPEGTLTPAMFMGRCDGNPLRLAETSDRATYAVGRAERAKDVVTRVDHLVGIWRSRPPSTSSQPEEWMLIASKGLAFTEGLVLWLDDRGIDRIWLNPGCGGLLVDPLRNFDVIIAPP